MSKDTKSNNLRAKTATDSEVVKTYLRENLDFFIEQTDLVKSLSIPHVKSGGISLIEHQVNLLRKENSDLKHKIRELIGSAEDNQRLFEGTRFLVLALLQAKTLNDYLVCLKECLLDQFKIDQVEIMLNQALDAEVSKEFARLEPEVLQRVLISHLAINQPFCGQCLPEFHSLLLQEDICQSQALIPLGDDGQVGCLVMGSHDKERFDADKGTLFIDYIADISNGMLKQFV